MRARSVSGAMLAAVGLVFLLLALNGAPRNNGFLALGVVFVILGGASTRRARRA
jgi:hypothetical protein